MLRRPTHNERVSLPYAVQPIANHFIERSRIPDCRVEAGRQFPFRMMEAQPESLF